MLDDLRRSTLDDDHDEIDDGPDFTIRTDDDEVSKRLFLGMTAVERMFLSIFLFLNVLVLGLAFLVVTGRVVF
jgi:hypothetical protein